MARRRALAASGLAVFAGWAMTAAALGPSPARVEPSQLEELVRRVSHEHGVDPRLAHAVIKVESDYDPSAVSRRGALGLMQLMPETARRLDVDDPFDPEQNLRGGIREVARLVERYSGNLALALAAYNAGEGAVEQFRGIPPYSETEGYVARVMTLYTGSPYRLSSLRAAPVRLERDAQGRAVISNQPRVTSSLARPGGVSAPAGGLLRGGFGAR